MATTLAVEQAEQRRWKLRPNYSDIAWYDMLVEREFMTPEQHHARESGELREIIKFAAEQVPYYRKLFADLGISADDIRGPEDLPMLPVLTRSDTQEHGERLRAGRLPEGHKISRETTTSGSTGQPVTILHSALSGMMFALLKQRQLRWARFDPMGRLAMIRPPQDLPSSSDGERLGEGETIQLNSWAVQVGAYFESGQVLGFSTRNSLESQMDWLEHHRPDYLLGQSAELEHLALGFQDRPAFDCLQAILAVTQQLMPEMQQRIERTFSAPVYENYGFNEIGIVATRCREGGRYHVNTEHCLVEIVDDEGNPCAPGRRGHLLATTLTNLAMPLLRYDSGDMAEAVDGPCPCGRTLPAFGAIHGRYRRIADLPENTFEFWSALRRALGDMPEELSKPMRQYQVHQCRDGSYELRLVTADDLAPAFHERIRKEWEATGAPEPPPLKILVVDRIPRPPGGKFQDFTSDFTPPPAID